MKSSENFPSISNLLAIETSAPVCSVALLHDGKISSRKAVGTGIHSEKTFQFIEELLGEQQLAVRKLDAVLVSAGPGSYTGLRIASSAAKGLLFGTDIRLIEADTLAGIAWGAVGEKRGRVHAVLNARRTHLYHQLFEHNSEGSLIAHTQPRILDINEINNMILKDDSVAGTGIQRLTLPGGTKILEGEDALDAAYLIRLLKQHGNQFCRETEPSSFEPAYQVPEG